MRRLVRRCQRRGTRGRAGKSGIAIDLMPDEFIVEIHAVARVWKGPDRRRYVRGQLRALSSGKITAAGASLRAHTRSRAWARYVEDDALLDNLPGLERIKKGSPRCQERLGAFTPRHCERPREHDADDLLSGQPLRPAQHMPCLALAVDPQNLAPLFVQDFGEFRRISQPLKIECCSRSRGPERHRQHNYAQCCSKARNRGKLQTRCTPEPNRRRGAQWNRKHVAVQAEHDGGGPRRRKSSGKANEILQNEIINCNVRPAVAAHAANTMCGAIGLAKRPK